MINKNKKEENKIKLKEVSKEDYGDLIYFLKNFENEKRDESFWLGRIEHWWDKNPAYNDSLKRGWCLTNEQNEIVGFIGSIPSYFQLNYHSQIVYNATTWRVKSKHRKQSLLLFSELIKQSKETILFDTTPSIEVIKILEAFRFSIFPNKQTKTYLYVCDFQNLFKEIFGESRGSLFLLKPFFWILSHIQSFFFKTPEISKNIIQISSAGREFDGLWEKTKGIYKNTNLRSSDAINWQCFSQHSSKKIIFGKYENGDLYSYAIYNEVKTKYTKMLVLNDIWGDNLDSKVLMEFYSSGKEYAIKNDFDMVMFNSFNNLQNKVLDKIIFIKRNKNDSRYYKSRKDLEAESTYLSLLHGDYGM